VSNRAFPLIAAVVVVLDQVTKWWVQQALPVGASQPLIPPLLRLTLVHNTGSAFSLFRGAGGWLILVSVLSLLGMAGYWLVLRRRSAAMTPLLLVGLSLPFGGAAGNLIDRVRLGYVIDFLELPLWPVFNIADSAITGGAVLLAIHFMRQDDKAGVRTEQTKDEHEQEARARARTGALTPDP
jgi:signal peptidase II